MLIVAYLTAIVAANLIITELGPTASIYTAFVLIGLDLTVRDALHEKWALEGRRLALSMGALILAGSALTFALNVDARQIAVASSVAFAAALTVDALVFQRLRQYGRFEAWNGSNIASAVVDSVIFPTLAFGAIMPEIMAGQIGAKIAGGLVWSLILLRRLPFAKASEA